MPSPRVNNAGTQALGDHAGARPSGDAVDAILGEWRSQRPDLDPTPMGVFGRLARVHARVKVHQARTLSRFGLNLAAFDVLANLRRSGSPFRKTPSELASSSMLTSGGVTFRLDKLEGQGLIRRVPSLEDRRAIYAELTERGLELIDEVIGAHLETEAAMLRDLTDEEVDMLADLLSAFERSVGRLSSDAQVVGPSAGDGPA